MLLIKKITNTLKFFLIIIFITFSLTLFIDFFFGKKILEATDNFWKKTEFYGRILRIDHPVYHHSLKKNVKLKKPDYMLVLPWHFKDYIVKRERDFLKKGGKLIFPLPEIEIV